MARKKKRASSKPKPAPAVLAPAGAATLPAEALKGDWTVILFGLMMVFAPGLGVPHEEMLQDTLKSIIVAFAALTAGLSFFWRQRHRRDALRWHGLVWLPLMLMAYALGSMLWSHTYLGGVEAIRWFIFSLILWLGLNTLARERLPWLALGIHAGAVVASLWAALQFWIDFRYFTHGPNPASTFLNRNFFAEFVVCTLPFSFLLLARARRSAAIALLAFSAGFNIVAVLMTGTRSALITLMALALVLPPIFFLTRRQFAFMRWDQGKRLLAVGGFLATVAGLGLIHSGNPTLLADGRGANALERGFKRSLSVTKKEETTAHAFSNAPEGGIKRALPVTEKEETTGHAFSNAPEGGLKRALSETRKEETSENTFSIRLVMWRATGRMIGDRPLSGVGAGAWEVAIPLYQSEGSELETDYYAHNEVLQLLAEYGLVGWLFLACLLSYLGIAAWRTWKLRSPEGLNEAPWRALTLASLLAFLIISNAGFPWRMASTGALFALCLAILAASDARLGRAGPAGAARLRWQPMVSRAMAVAMMACLALAATITQRAAESESKIVRSIQLALAISQSGDPNNPRWDRTKSAMLRLIREGTAINPHYRKYTPRVADALATWGDWRNAIWIWESVIGSRPYVVAILSNIARGYAQLGDNEKAFLYLERSKKLQPNAPSVRSLEVILLSRIGREDEAARLAKAAFAIGAYDIDLVNAAYELGARRKDWDLALQGLELRNRTWPAQAVDGWLKIAHIYGFTEKKDPAKALEAYRSALAAAPDKESVRRQVPAPYNARL